MISQQTTLGPKPQSENGLNTGASGLDLLGGAYESPGIFTGSKKSGLTGGGTSSLSVAGPSVGLNDAATASSRKTMDMGTPTLFSEYQSGNVTGGAPASPMAQDLSGLKSDFKLNESGSPLGTMQQESIANQQGQWTAKDEAFSKGSKAAMGIAGSVVGNMAQRKADSATNEYNKMLENWMAQGKYWFDPNSNITPDFDEYIDGMPSSTETAAESHMFGGIDPNTKGGRSVSNFVNPAGAGARALGMDSEKVNYVWGKSSSRAVEEMGKTGSPYGLIKGGIIGLIEGFLGWSEAEKQDKRMMKEAHKAYDLKMKQWKEERRLRRKALKTKANAENNARLDRMSSESEQKKAKVAATKMNRREMIKASVLGAGGIANAARERGLKR